MWSNHLVYESDLMADQAQLDPSMDVSGSSTYLRLYLIWSQRGEHDIEDELVFSNHKGYVFHDSRGIESGSIDELKILQQFIRSRCGARRLRDRLHAIWFGSRMFTITTTDGHILRYCVPMDNQRPELDLKFYHDICPDRNGALLRTFMTVTLSNALL